MLFHTHPECFFRIKNRGCIYGCKRQFLASQKNMEKQKVRD